METTYKASIELENNILNTLEMKKSISKVNKENSRIKEKMEELVETEKSSYYNKFSTDFEKKRDLKQIKNELNELISVKNGHLDLLIININLVKKDLSKCETILILENGF